MPLPTEFPGYDKLPNELKFLIVGQAAAELTDCQIWRRVTLAQYACIDRVWQETIERSTFESLSIKRNDIEDFGKICGKRHGFLHRIELSPYIGYSPDLDELVGQFSSGLEEADIGVLVSHAIRTTVHSLFDIMTNWSHKDRRRPELVKLNLFFNIATLRGLLKQPINIDFSGLPTVNVIGSFYEVGDSLMDASSRISIYNKLPNLDRVFLNFYWQPTDAGFVQEATDALDSLRRLPSVPRELSIVSSKPKHQGTYGDFWICQVELPLLRCLSGPSPRWSDTITNLRLSGVRDVPQLIRQSQMTSWPQLRTLFLSGGIQTEFVATRTESGEMIIQSLIGALSKMPKVNTITTYICPYEEPQLAKMYVDLHLVPGYEHPGNLPFELPFERAANKGITVIGWASLSGQSAAELQDAVWSHHGRDLEVFCTANDDWLDDLYDGSDDWSWGYDSRLGVHKCKQWNRQKNQWDRFTSVPLMLYIFNQDWVLVEDSDNFETHYLLPP